MVGIVEFAGPCICEDLPADRIRAVETMILQNVPPKAIQGRYGWSRRNQRQHAKQCMPNKRDERESKEEA